MTEPIGGLKPKSAFHMKWWPFKLVCTFLYGVHESIEILSDKTVRIRIARFARWHNIPHSRLKGYLEDCADLQMIEDLRFTKQWALFKLSKTNLDLPS